MSNVKYIVLLFYKQKQYVQCKTNDDVNEKRAAKAVQSKLYYNVAAMK
jgi:hypothetical protein